MKTTRDFVVEGDRYAFDFNGCSFKKGWCQIDTEQDAYYFGMWCHPDTLKIFSYVEGDTILTQCNNKEEFKKEIMRVRDFYGKEFLGIDCTGKQEDFFKSMGLEALLY